MNENNKVDKIDAQEFEAAEQEAKTSSTAYTHKFNTPFTYEGKTYNELTFEWGKLTGNDSLAIEAEMQDLGKVVISPEFSSDYLIRMASRACIQPIGSDAFCAMSLRDYNRIRSKARSFLLNAAL